MSTQKLGRNYQLTVSGPNFLTPLVISLPFTIEFDITRNVLTSANVCQVRLYNLSQSNRNALRRNDTDYGAPFESIVLQAGYGNMTLGKNLPVIFSGNVSQAWSVREGVNFITQIECYDGGYSYANAQIPSNLANPPAGTPRRSFIMSLIQSLPQVKLGSVGAYPGVLPRGNTYTGSTIDNLYYLTGGGFFIDKGIGNALGNNEFSTAGGTPFIIDSSTGLLNTPVLERNILRWDMIFEPNLIVGSQVIVKTTTLDKSVISSLTSQANVNGPYKVTSVKHRGMISQTICGEVITSSEFLAYTPAQVPVPSAAGGGL